MNLTPGNVLTANVLLNVLDSQDSGISPFDPISVSTNNHSYLYLLGLKDQITVSRDTLLEFGVARAPQPEVLLFPWAICLTCWEWKAEAEITT